MRRLLRVLTIAPLLLQSGNGFGVGTLQRASRFFKLNLHNGFDLGGAPASVDTTSSASMESALQPMRPESIRVVPLHNVKRPTIQEKLDAKGFVLNLRSAAPYLHMHAGQAMVVHISSELVGTREFCALMDDLALMKLLGLRLVLVCSLRSQVDRRLQELGRDPTPVVGDFRVTDAHTMQVVKEMSGFVRAEVEARMSRSLRSGSSLTGMEGVNVIGGNLFFTPQPIGVRQGVDFGHSGEVRRVDGDAMAKRLAAGDLILLTSLGYASSGEAYDVLSESLACEVAAALQARKLIWVTDGHSFTVDDDAATAGAGAGAGSSQGPGLAGESSTGGRVVQCLRMSEATALLRHYDVGLTPKFRDSTLTAPASPEALAKAVAAAAAAHGRAVEGGEVEKEEEAALEDGPAPALLASLSAEAAAAAGVVADEATARLVNLVRFSVSALKRGVTRAHLVPPSSGDLLRELYTTDGAGTLISRDLYDGIRKATEQDVGGVLAIIEPLVEQGILVKRTAADLQAALDTTYVFVRDGHVIACGQLVPYVGAAGGGAGKGVGEPQPAAYPTDALLSSSSSAAAGAGAAADDGNASPDDSASGGLEAAASADTLPPAHASPPTRYLAAEISCLAVSPKYRGARRGDAMLTYLERVAVGMGIPDVFVLSCRTVEFFKERGFDEVPPSWLPADRPYDLARNSKVYSKHLRGNRDMDMEELFWENGAADDEEDGGESVGGRTGRRGRTKHQGAGSSLIGERRAT